MKVKEQSARVPEVSRSPEGDYSSKAGNRTFKSKLPIADATLGKSFDPKKLVNELDQKLQRLQMMSAATDFENIKLTSK